MNERVAVACNPDEGQVAIPWSRPDCGYVVGRLGTRAMRWVEEATGSSIDDIYSEITLRMMAAAAAGGQATPQAPSFSVRVATTIIWAAIEHERRLQKGPGPEYSIDDADEIVEGAEVGMDGASQYALTLLQLSLPFRKRTERMDSVIREKLGKSVIDPLKAAATAAATGTSSSAQPSSPASP